MTSIPSLMTSSGKEKDLKERFGRMADGLCGYLESAREEDLDRLCAILLKEANQLDSVACSLIRSALGCVTFSGRLKPNGELR